MSVTAASEMVLPPLREDLQLLDGPAMVDGSPTWTLFDPIRNSYYRIGWIAFQLLSRWSSGTAQQLKENIKQNTTCNINDNDIRELLRFLYANNLTLQPASGNSSDYLEQYRKSKPNRFVWFLKNYLFLRIPLFRPGDFFRSILPYVEPLYSATARNTILLLGLIGLFLASRQWDSFLSTFSYFFSLKGLLFYFITLIFIKILHEMGHAITATRFGCRIPAMGVAFLVLYPVLYTDTTDAHRLTSRKQRLYIGMAGMLTEFYLACISIFLWSFLPDGIFRSIVFIVATVSIFLTLLVNLSPFMRFDGYYILSDWLGVQNLHSRSFALGKWKLRELLFGLKERPPERFPENMQKFLVIFSWSVWIYRFLLLAGIALLVYHLFFKLLGIFLLVAELFFFIIMPITRECRVWYMKRSEIITTKHTWALVTLLTAILLLFIIPWNSRISFPAVMEPADKTVIYAPAPGQINEIRIAKDERVNAGDELLSLSSPEIANEIRCMRRERRRLRKGSR